MASSNLPDVLSGGDHASRPAATAVVAGATYSCTDHGLEYQSDGATWSTRSTFGTAGGIAATLLDAKGDLIAASAADTAAKVTVGANGSYLRAASGAGAGLEWQLNKFDATTAPTANEDSGDGYSVGSIWIDVTGDDAYICVDATPTAAVWIPFDSSSGESWEGAWSAGTYTLGQIVEHDDVIYQVNASSTADEPPGTDWDVLYTAPGGSDPRDFPAAYTLDDIAIGGGVQFDEAAGTPTGMSVIGTIASTEYAAMPGLDLLLDHGDHLYIADPGGDLEAMLHFSDIYDGNAMMGIGFVDNSGNGHCFVQYQNNLYQMGATSNVYSGTGNSVGSQTLDHVNTFGHVWIAVKRVGTTLTARMSRDGTDTGFSSATSGVTNSTSTRIVVGRWYSNGGKKVRMHRLVIATPDLGV